jgi:hypothetical protein
MLHRVALGRTDVSEDLNASIIHLVTLMMEALSSSEKSVIQEPHGVTSKKTAFFE